MGGGLVLTKYLKHLFDKSIVIKQYGTGYKYRNMHQRRRGQDIPQKACVIARLLNAG